MNRRAIAPVISRYISGTVLFAFFLVLGLAGTSANAQSSKTWIKRGQSAETRQDYDTALDAYQKALEKSPKDLTARTSLARVRVTTSGMHMTKGRKLTETGDLQSALAEFMRAASVDPSNQAAEQEIIKVKALISNAPAPLESDFPQPPGTQEHLNAIGSPVQLKPMSSDPITLHMSEDAKVVYQAVGKAAGINILFDSDYNSKRTQVDLNNVSLYDALRIIGVLTNTFWRPVTSNTIFVALNSRQKRTDLDGQAVQTFYLTNAAQQNDLNDVGTALRTVLTNAKVFNVPSQNALIVRGTPDELMLAQKLVDDLDKARAEVVVDVAVMEVSKNWERNLGIQYPQSISASISPLSSTTNNSNNSNNNNSNGTNNNSSTTTTTSPNVTLNQLANLGSSDIALSVGAATANFLLNDTNTKILQSPRIRATDQQKASMKIGERIPIATGSYQGGVGVAAVSSLVNTQFQYQDVGVQIEMTPTVHYNHDVTIKIKIEVTAQNGNVTISGVTEPIISQRVIDQTIRLREGEASILGGIQNKQDTLTKSGIPGLSSIPILKYIFGNTDHAINDDELVFMLIPHIVRSQTLDNVNLRPVDTGSGQSIDLRYDPDASLPPPIQPTKPTAKTQPGFGTVPGGSAQEAAPQAIRQMQQAADANTAPPRQTPPPQAPIQTAPPPNAARPTAQQNAPEAVGFTPGISFTVMGPTTPVAVGSTIKIPIVLSSTSNVDSVPMQIQYDTSKLTLVSAENGDFLGKDGQAVAMVHRDSNGIITMNVSRPPQATGVSGAGTICTLGFQIKSAGATDITLLKQSVIDDNQRTLQAPGSKVTITAK